MVLLLIEAADMSHDEGVLGYSELCSDTRSRILAVGVLREIDRVVKDGKPATLDARRPKHVDTRLGRWGDVRRGYKLDEWFEDLVEHRLPTVV